MIFKTLILILNFMATPTAYCVKCKKKNVEMKDAKKVTMKGKGGKTRYALKGACPTCGTTMFRILSADQAKEY